MVYAVKLDVFEGPLDLLLQLVSKQRLDVADVSISTITEEYLAAVRKMEEVDLDLASRFLVLAATLLELKSMKLLPKQTTIDPELARLLEERDHLIHRLIEYSTFRAAAEAISVRFAAHSYYHYRDPQIPAELIETTPDPLAGITVQQVHEAAIRALLPKPQLEVDRTHITPITVSVGEVMDSMLGHLVRGGAASFKELCAAARTKIDIIVRFLALLELYKRQDVDVEQGQPFGEIVVRHRRPNIGTGRRTT